MPISTTNVSLNAIHVECGGTSGTQVSLNEADIRGIGNPSSTYDGGDGISGGTTTQISIGEFRGAEDTVDYSPLVQTTGSMRLSSNGNGFTTFRSRTAAIVINNSSGVYARAVLSGNTVQLKIREFNSLSTSTYINNFNTTQTLSTTEVNGSSKTYNSGDVDAMKLVADGVNALRDKGRSFLVITHYQRLLDHIKPDFVHIMADGRIIKSGGPELALQVENNGYSDLLAEVQ